MFLCKDCTHPEYKDYFEFAFISKGPCENCGYTDICIESPHDVKIDPNWQENVELSLMRAKQRTKE